MDTLATITGILVLAALSEALVEYLVRPVVKPFNGNHEPEPVREPSSNQAGLDWRDLTMRYTAALVGVLLCLTYRTDLLIFFDLSSPWPWVGYVITGLLIGRGANFVHDFTSRWLKPN